MNLNALNHIALFLVWFGLLQWRRETKEPKRREDRSRDGEKVKGISGGVYRKDFFRRVHGRITLHKSLFTQPTGEKYCVIRAIPT